MFGWITNFTRTVEGRASQSEPVYKLAARYYKDVIQKEAVLANITGNDRILCIGGGCCPFSAILFHQMTGATVTVIDQRSACIPASRQVINRLGLGESVRVLCQDGRSAEIPFSEYTVVHLALQVSPIEQVFSQVARQIAPGTKLLIRRPKKHLERSYGGLLSTALGRCPYTTHSKARNVGSTLLYLKEEQPNEEKMAAYRFAHPLACGCARPA